MRPPTGSLVLTVVHGSLALNAWAQVALVPLGRSDDPAALTALQALIGAAGVMAARGAWTRARWAPAAAVAHGVITAGMLLALVPLLALPADARGGLAVGAAVFLLFALASARYLRRVGLRGGAARRAPSPHVPPG